MRKQMMILLLLVAGLAFGHTAMAQRYARFEVYLVESAYNVSYYQDNTITAIDDYDRAALYIQFYSDAACTQPLNIPQEALFDVNVSGTHYDLLNAQTTTYNNNQGTLSAPVGTSEMLLDDIYYPYTYSSVFYTGAPNNYLLHEVWVDSEYYMSFISGGFTILPTYYHYTPRTYP